MDINKVQAEITQFGINNLSVSDLLLSGLSEHVLGIEGFSLIPSLHGILATGLS